MSRTDPTLEPKGDADAGYQGPKMARRVAIAGCWKIQMVNRSDVVKGYVGYARAIYLLQRTNRHGAAPASPTPTATLRHQSWLSKAPSGGMLACRVVRCLWFICFTSRSAQKPVISLFRTT